jgi:multidrug efflux pump subunit AcrB
MLSGFTQADEDISFEGMKKRQEAALNVVLQDPDVLAVGSSIGGTSSAGFNTGRMFIQLKAVGQRRATADQIIQRMRIKLAAIPRIMTYLQSVQNIQLGGRISRTQYQYTLQDTDLNEVNNWAPNILAKLEVSPLLQDVASDQQTGSPTLMIDIDRDAAARLGVNVALVQQTLSDAYGQPYVTQLYAPMNTYHIVIGVEPHFQQDLASLSQLYVHGSWTAMIPISQFAKLKFVPGTIAVNHQGQFPAFVQSGAGCRTRSGRRGDQADRGLNGQARNLADLIPGNGAGIPALIGDATVAHRCGLFRRLRGARRRLRELHPPIHDSPQPALSIGGCAYLTETLWLRS